jgi:hypothetical protein
MLRLLGAVALVTIPIVPIVGMGCTTSGNFTPVGSDSGADSGPPVTTPDSGGGDTGADTGTSTLYTRLGGHAGIEAAVAKIVTAELADPDLASYFFNQVASPVPEGHPTVAQLEECFTDQLGGAAGGPEQYPTTVNPGDAGTFTCRDMATIHGPLMISGGTFDKFILIAAGELTTLGVAAADVATVGGVLTSERPAIVAASLNDAGELPYDAGTDAPTTLYQRLGGHAGIRAAVNAIVGQELGDPDLASYFFNQVATTVPAGHPTTDQLEECFTDQLGSAAGGPENYPMTVTDDAGSFTCRDMTTIHAPLRISGGTFDKFIMIAGAELTTLGVSAADVTTVAGVLESERPAIVDANRADAGEEPYNLDGG